MVRARGKCPPLTNPGQARLPCVMLSAFTAPPPPPPLLPSGSPPLCRNHRLPALPEDQAPGADLGRAARVHFWVHFRVRAAVLHPTVLLHKLDALGVYVCMRACPSPLCPFPFPLSASYAKTRFYLNDALIVVMVALLTFCNSYSNGASYEIAGRWSLTLPSVFFFTLSLSAALSCTLTCCVQDAPSCGLVYVCLCVCHASFHVPVCDGTGDHP